MTGLEPAWNGFAIRRLTIQQHTHIFWYPCSDSNWEQLLLLRETTLPICPQGHWWAERELNSHSIDYESTALPLSYQPNNWHPHEESNLDSQFRRLLHYPLYYGDKLGANGRTRTDKPKREILSLLCLPISPHSQKLWRKMWESNSLSCFHNCTD